jgi:hypothetical protein
VSWHRNDNLYSWAATLVLPSALGWYKLSTCYSSQAESPALLGVAPLIHYSPDSFLGEFLFRVERSNLAEAGG